MASITSLEALHQEAFDKGIEVDRHHFSATGKSRCFKDGDYELIVINTSFVDSTAKEYVVMAEELSHLETGALYRIDNTFNTQASRMNRVKLEGTAKRHAFTKYMPVNKIEKYVGSGTASMYEVADELCVPLDFLHKAIEYHRSCGVVFSFDDEESYA